MGIVIQRVKKRRKRHITKGKKKFFFYGLFVWFEVDGVFVMFIVGVTL